MRYVSALSYSSSIVYGAGLNDLRGVTYASTQLYAVSNATSAHGVIALGPPGSVPTSATSTQLMSGLSAAGDPFTLWVSLDKSLALVSTDAGPGARGTLLNGAIGLSYSFTLGFTIIVDANARVYSVTGSTAGRKKRAWALTSNALYFVNINSTAAIKAFCGERGDD